MKHLIWVALFIVGCQSLPYEPITLPDGKSGRLVSCVNNISICYQLALQACPNGYTIIDKTQTSFSNYSFYWPRTWLDSGQFNIRTATNIALALKCRAGKIKLKTKDAPSR